MDKIIVFWTNDEVNIDLARSWCDEQGLIFQLGDQRDELFPADAAALVLDLNHLALRHDELEQVVARVHQALLPYPVAVACYNFSPRVLAASKTRGLLAFRSVGPQLFQELTHAISSASGDFAA